MERPLNIHSRNGRENQNSGRVPRWREREPKLRARGQKDTRCQKENQDVRERAKMSEREPRCQRESQDVGERAKMSEREPRCQNERQDIGMGTKVGTYIDSVLIIISTIFMSAERLH